jgi:hypothetical protein
MKVAATFAALASALCAAGACDLNSLPAQSLVVEQTCCTGETCDGGLPANCNQNCKVSTALSDTLSD